MVQIAVVCTVFLCCFPGHFRDNGFQIILVRDGKKPYAGEVDIDGDVLFAVDLLGSVDLDTADEGVDELGSERFYIRALADCFEQQTKISLLFLLLRKLGFEGFGLCDKGMLFGFVIAVHLHETLVGDPPLYQHFTLL